MSFRILADEHIEHQLVQRLRQAGHDVEHVATTAALGKGTADDEIVRHAHRHNRIILTGDYDFLTDFDLAAHEGLLFLEDEMLGVDTIATIVNTIATLVEQDQFSGVFYLSPNWLEP